MIHLFLLIAATLSAEDPAIEKALRYLAVEVPAWKTANHCYSCHNNGDAARALMVAGRTGPIADTLTFLRAPETWDKQQADAPNRDKGLARIQFSFALAQAVESGLAPREPYVMQAAGRLAAMQSANGSWPLEQDSTVGSPATYGTPLATYAAIRTLLTVDRDRFADAIGRGRKWLAAFKPAATVDFAAVALALRDRKAYDWLLQSQTRDGAWGPYRASPAEVFDTAIAILALTEAGETAAVARGVAWLKKEQWEEGGWTGTTRPTGAGSYAQHISTSGWATLALLKAKQ